MGKYRRYDVVLGREDNPEAINYPFKSTFTKGFYQPLSNMTSQHQIRTIKEIVFYYYFLVWLKPRLPTLFKMMRHSEFGLTFNL